MMKSRKHLYKYHIIGVTFTAFTLLLLFMGSVARQKEADSNQITLFDSELALSKSKNNVYNNDIDLMGFSNDPFSDTQWYIDNPGKYTDLTQVMKQETISTAGVDMDVVDAWQTMENSGVTDNEVIVAVIDTGVDYKHPDLTEHMWMNEGEIPNDKIDNDHNGYVDDVNGWDFYNNDNTVCHYQYSKRYRKYLASPEDNDNHGTHVAGIIAAVANNHMGIAGIASNINIKIMALKINGGEKGDGDIPNAIEAIKYATKMGADICNLSWGTQLYSAELEQVIKESDMLFVAAAGNTGANNDKKPMYPASLDLDNVISVTFINADGELTKYSNYGATSVDLGAPGDDIYSTIVGSYASMSGSSMAAPQVTAVAAMLYAYNDRLYASNVKEIITSNLKELKDLDHQLVYGGIPSANKAVLAATELKQDKAEPVMSFETAFNKDKMTISVHVEDDGDSKVRVVKWIYGEKSVEDFMHGMNGTTVNKGKVDFSKGGTYTFYSSDYAGNETVQTYEVAQDSSAPKLTTTFTVANDYKSRTIKITVNDEQSGLKRVEYMPGVKKAADFLPADAGKEIIIKDGKGKFTVKKDGVYTIFATDYRGNITVRPIVIKTLKATSLQLSFSKKTIYIGEEFALRTYVEPAGSTDKITYTSSDETVATVSATGKVTALKVGKTTITATTASGLTSVCVITVETKKSG